jgi:hypothetical protein
MSLQIAELNTLAPIKAAEKIVELERAKDKIESSLAVLRSRLLEVTKENDVLTLKTGQYTIMRKQLRRIKVLNDDEAGKFLESKGVPVETRVVLDMRYMKPVIQNYQGEIPGIEKTLTEYVSVRLAKEKEQYEKNI